MKKLLLTIALSFAVFLLGVSQPSVALAQLAPGETAGPCGSLTCTSTQTKIEVFGSGSADICTCKNNTPSAGTTPTTTTSGDDVFGTIEAPAGVARYNQAAGAEGGIGLITFFSTLIRLATIAAGVWVMVNFILAGWTYITSNGEAKAHTEVAQKITFSVVGLVLIVSAYTAAAILGLVLFGDASYILNPTFQGVAPAM